MNIQSMNNATQIIPVIDMLEKAELQLRAKANTPSFRVDINHRNMTGS